MIPICQVTVLVDTRENYPLPFPDSVAVGSGPHRTRVFLRTKPAKLDAGDYCLEASPSTCIVERKASRNELATNLFDPKDQPRALRAFKRLAEATTAPILMLEVSPHELAIPAPTKSSRGAHFPLPNVTGAELLSRICTLVAHHNLHLMWFARATHRVRIGEAVAQMMISYALHKDAKFLQKCLTSSP